MELMKRNVAKIWCVLVLITGGYLSLNAQDKDVRIGFQVSPVFSGIKSKDNLIVKSDGNLGLKLGAISDIHFKDKMFFTLGLNLAFHEGGEFMYEIGGNYLPDSELSDPLLQTGDKPLPDGTKIRYQLRYLEVPVGLKFRFEGKGSLNYYVEAPIFTFSLLTRGRGDIETEDYLYEDENIYKDLNVVNLFLGFGAGIEYPLGDNSALIGGLGFQRGLFDFTKDNGYRSVPNPDIIPPYIRQEEDSRAVVSNLVLMIGLLF
jgi:hypothetical protein